MGLNLAIKEGSAAYIDGEPLRVIAATPPDPDNSAAFGVFATILFLRMPSIWPPAKRQRGP
jgi:hypothetical protein